MIVFALCFMMQTSLVNSVDLADIELVVVPNVGSNDADTANQSQIDDGSSSTATAYTSRKQSNVWGTDQEQEDFKAKISYRRTSITYVG